MSDLHAGKTSAIRYRTRNRVQRHPSGTGRVVLLFIFGAYFLLPLYWLVIASTKSTSDLYGTNGFWFHAPQLFDNIGQLTAYDAGIYVQWLLNSLLYSTAGASVATILALMAGYAFAKMRFAGRKVLFSVILAGVLVPPTALALPLYLLASQIHVVNTYWAVLIPSFITPFGVYLARVYTSDSVPDEILESASLDGASEGRVFVDVVLPLLRPAAVTIFLFQFVAIWNNFFLPLVMLSSQKLYPVTLGLQQWTGRANREPILYSLIVTGSLVSVLPLLVAVLILQRYWQGGLSAGAVKA